MDQRPEFMDDISGASALLSWFGHWPSFHDAEVLSFILNRKGISIMEVHTWLMKQEVDSEGYYVLEKHTIVQFELREIYRLDLAGWNHQNVVSGLVISKQEEGIQIDLGGCYGVEGSLGAKKVDITFQTGRPSK